MNPMNNKTILIVEDEESIRLICEMALQEAGYKTHCAENGYEALKLIQEHAVDLILSDIFMPKMNGFQLIRSIKADDYYKHIPFIFLTAATDDGHITEGLQLGVDDYITKPIRIKELLARVQLTLAKAEARKQTAGSPAVKSAIQPHPDTSDAVHHPKGSLKDRALIDVIAFCENNSLTGELIVESAKVNGKLTYRKGELIEAVADNKKDDEALDELLSLTEGTFEIVQQLITFGAKTKKDAETKKDVLPSAAEIKAQVAEVSPAVAAVKTNLPPVDAQVIIKIIHAAEKSVSKLLGEAKSSNLLRRCQLTLVNSYPALGFFLVSQKGTLSMIKPVKLTAHDLKGCAEWIRDYSKSALEKDKMLIGFDVKNEAGSVLTADESGLLEQAGFWGMIKG